MAAPTPRPTSVDNPAGRFFGILLMVAGGLIASLSGLCTLAVGVTSLMSFRPGPHAFEGLLPMVAVMGIFGGVPFAFGAVAFILGRNLHRASQPPTPTVAKTFD